MRGGIKKTLCVAALALAIAPAAAFASGGIPGGGGTAVPVGGGGGGVNSGGGGGGGSATTIQLSATLDHTINYLAATGTAAYKADGTRRELKINAQGINFGQNLNVTAADILLDGKLFVEVPVVNGSFSLSADTNAGASVPVLAAGSTIAVIDPATQDTIFNGIFK